MCTNKGTETCTGTCEKCAGETAHVADVSHLFGQKPPLPAGTDGKTETHHHTKP